MSHHDDISFIPFEGEEYHPDDIEYAKNLSIHNVNTVDFYEVDFSRVKTLTDVINILQILNIQITMPRGEISEEFQPAIHLLNKLNT